MKTAIEVDLSLEHTLFSSFACYLFTEKKTAEETTWIGQVDPIRGAKLTQREGKVEIALERNSQTVLDYLIHDAIGLWHKPNPEDVETSRALQKLAQDVLPGIRVPKLHRNKWHVLLSALLSVHAKVSYSRAWFLSLTKYSLRDFETMTPLQLRDRTKSATGISAGFRMRYLTELVNDLFQKYPDAEDPLEELCRKPAPELRVQLLQLRNLGPKVCDCFLLNAMGDLSSPPIDVHVKRVSEYLGILPAGLGMPMPPFCRDCVCSKEDSERYGLPLCPRADRTLEYLEKKLNPSGTCIRAAMTYKFKQAGWIQAILFLFGQRFCTRTPRGEPDCSNCPMKDNCLRDTFAPPVQTHRIRLHILRPRLATSTTPQFAELPLFQLYPEEKEVVNTESREIFGKVRRKPLRKKNVTATCIWMACRLRKLPVLIDEVASAYSVRPSHILELYKEIKDQAGIHVGLADPKRYIDRLQRAFNLPETLVSRANLLADRNRGRCQNPVSLAAASVFQAACGLNQPIGQREISKQLALSEVTIRNIVKKCSMTTRSSGRLARRVKRLGLYKEIDD